MYITARTVDPVVCFNHVCPMPSAPDSFDSHPTVDFRELALAIRPEAGDRARPPEKYGMMMSRRALLDWIAWVVVKDNARGNDESGHLALQVRCIAQLPMPTRTPANNDCLPM